MKKRNFIAIWGQSFGIVNDEALVKNVDLDFFNTINGYSEDDLSAITMLSIGESWVSREYSDHSVVRIK